MIKLKPKYEMEVEGINKARSCGHYEFNDSGEPCEYVFDLSGERYRYSIMDGSLQKLIDKKTIGKNLVYKKFVGVNRGPLEEITNKSFAKVRDFLGARANPQRKRMPLLYRIILNIFLKKASNEFDRRLHSYS